jgi:hypothetical protein
MTRTRHSRFFVIAAAVVASTPMFAGPADAQGRPPTPVTIVAPVPVPVTGSVTLGGEGAVKVTNPADEPVPVRDIDRIPRERFQVSTVPASFSGSIGSTAVVTVPADRRLVIEHASAWINSGGAGGLLGVNLSSGTPLVVNLLPCSAIGQNALNFVYACVGPTLHYVSPGETLTFSVETFASSGGFFRVFVSGYYEPAP